MPSYKYRVIFENGKIGRGKILALNKSQAIESLKNEEVQPIMIKRIKENKKKYKKFDYNKIKRKSEYFGLAFAGPFFRLL